MGTWPSCGNWLKSVILCIGLGCLAPERPGYGGARAAPSMDLDEICKLAHKLFTDSLWLLIVTSLRHAITHLLFVFLWRMIIMAPKKCRASNRWCWISVSFWASIKNTTAGFRFLSLRRFLWLISNMHPWASYESFITYLLIIFEK